MGTDALMASRPPVDAATPSWSRRSSPELPIPVPLGDASNRT